MRATSRRRRPTTPGEILREEFLIPLAMTQKQLADHLACSTIGACQPAPSRAMDTSKAVRRAIASRAAPGHIPSSAAIGFAGLVGCTPSTRGTKIMKTMAITKMAGVLAGVLLLDGITWARPPFEWPVFNHDDRNTRANRPERSIPPDTVDRLAPRRRVDGLSAVTSTPAVVKGVVYFGDWSR